MKRYILIGWDVKSYDKSSIPPVKETTVWFPQWEMRGNDAANHMLIEEIKSFPMV